MADEFDPSKPFKKVASTGDEFDPSKPFKKVEDDTSPGIARTALQHGGNMLMMGYLPQIAARTQPAVDWAMEKITGTPIETKPYVQERDAIIQGLKEAEETNPGTALASKVGGGILGAVATPLPALGMGKGILASAARGGLYGAGQAALANPGDVKGIVDPVQAEERVSNAIHGLGVGAATGGLSASLEKGLGALARSPQAAEKFASTKAFKGSGAMLKDWRASAAKDEIDDIGNFMIDRLKYGAGDTVESVAQKAKALNVDAGKALDEIYSKGKGVILPTPMQAAIDKAGFNPLRDKDALIKIAQEKIGDSVRAKGAITKLSEYIDGLAEKYGDVTLDPKTANKIKGFLDEEVNYSRNPLTKEPATEKVFYQARKFINDKILGHVDEIGKAMGDPKAAEALKKANQDFGYSRQVMNLAKDRSLREGSNRMISLTDTIAGSAVGTVGGLMAGGDAKHASATGLGLGLLGALGNKGARMYGPGVQASVGRMAAPVLRYSAAPIGRAGDGLMQSINPDVLARLLAQSNAMKEKQ